MDAASMKIYAFDVDDTLDVSGGPVSLAQLARLRLNGHVVGLCGNYAVFCQKVKEWHRLISFIGAIGTSKAAFLSNLKVFLRPYDSYVMVGNEIDKIEAHNAGWEFVYAEDFKEGLE